MSNHSLKPLSPLGAFEPQINEIGALRITEVIDKNLASLAQRMGQEKAFAAAAKKLFKMSLPEAGMSAIAGAFTILWSGPDQYFVEAPEETHDDIAAILKAGFKETASITEQSGGWCRFDIEGKNAVLALERLCAADVQMMRTHAATRCVVEHIGVFVLCREAGKAFSVYGPRSFANSLHHALATAATSVA